MFASALALCLLTQPTATESWTGELTFTIKGEGSTKNSTSWAKWKIDREVKGRIVLDRMDKGATIAGTPDGKNLARYESWNGNARLPIQVRINDEVIQRGPLFSPKEIRLDTLRVKCPVSAERAPKYKGEIGWPTLQIDLKEGKFLWDAPRLEAPVEYFFRREFVEGPKSWTSKPPLVEDKVSLDYQAIFDMNQPKEWFKISGAFKPGQTELVLTRKFPFTVMLMAGLTPGKVNAEMTLVLRKSGS